MKRIILFTLFLFSCAPVSIVIDRYDNNREKTVAIMKVDKKDGFVDSVTVELLTYHPNGQLASSTDMLRNIQHGKHVAYSPTGEVIAKGQFENNRKSDKWSWFGRDGIPDSLRTFEKGMLSGKSVDYSSSGEKTREIMYLNHKYHGKSIQYNDNGKKSLIGEYMHGIPHGKWTWFNTSGKKERIVTYKKGIKDGPVSIWNDQGKKAMTGTYINDKKNGEWKWHSDNKGLDSLIQFSENKYMGKYQIWHVNGQKAVNGEYQNGIKIGEWKWYTINGNLDSTKIFSNGMLNGPVQFYYGSGTAINKVSTISFEPLEEIISKVKNKIIPGESKIKTKMTYSNGKLQGEKIDYYLNGQEQSSWTYDMGIRTGPFTEWNSSGLKKESGTYLNDKPNGVIYNWYGHGQLFSVTTYSKGDVHGVMRIYSPSGVITKEAYFYFGQPLCQLDYFDNGRIKQVQVFKRNIVVFQKNWNNLGMETTLTRFKTGITTKTDRYYSGNLRSEKSMKGNELHGLSWEFNEEHALEHLSLYIDGKHVFRRDYLLEENEYKDYIFPNSELQVVVKIEVEEN